MTCADIMQELPGRINKDAAKGWNATIQFKFAGDGGGDWHLTVKDGEPSLGEGSTDAPTATVHTTAENWVGMTTGKLNPMQLFMSGQLKVEGNIADVMKLNDPNVFKKD